MPGSETCLPADSCFSLLALKNPTNCIGLVQSEHRHRLVEM